MINESYKVEGKGFTIFYESNKKIRDIAMNEFSDISKATFNNTGKAVYKKNISANIDICLNTFLSKPAIGQYLKDQTESLISSLSSNKIIEEDNRASYVNKYVYMSVFGKSSTDLSYVCAALNSGYCLNLNFIRDIASRENIDIEKELECLLADVKSYWALKLTNDKPDALAKLEKNITERDNKLDLIRNKVFEEYSIKMATSNGFKKALGAVKLLDDSMKNVIYTKDKWTLFFVYMESFSFCKNGEPDYFTSCYLRSLDEKSTQDITGETYPLKIYLCFKVAKGLFGYKFIRPDGRTF